VKGRQQRLGQGGRVTLRKLLSLRDHVEKFSTPQSLHYDTVLVRMRRKNFFKMKNIWYIFEGCQVPRDSHLVLDIFDRHVRTKQFDCDWLLITFADSLVYRRKSTIS